MYCTNVWSLLAIFFFVMLINMRHNFIITIIILSIFNSSGLPRSNEGMRLLFSAVIGVMLGYLFGISFPTVNVTKVNMDHLLLLFSSTSRFCSGKKELIVSCSSTFLPVLSHILKTKTLVSQPKHCWIMHGHLQIVKRGTILSLTLTKFLRYFAKLWFMPSLF